jgi:DNA-directed RNA polymerase subunit RPC12/RpoP
MRGLVGVPCASDDRRALVSLCVRVPQAVLEPVKGDGLLQAEQHCDHLPCKHCSSTILYSLRLSVVLTLDTRIK